MTSRLAMTREITRRRVLRTRRLSATPGLPPVGGDQYPLEDLELLQALARADRDARERLGRDVDGHAGLGLQPLLQPLQGRPPPAPTDVGVTPPPGEPRAPSAVPPPMSTPMLPRGSWMGRPAPMAAAIGSSMMNAARAPAEIVASSTARCSTLVMPLGTHTTTRGFARNRRGGTFWMKKRNIFSGMSKSAITPSFSGRMAR